MLSYDQAAAKVQWRDAVRAVTEAIEDAGGVVNNVNDASTVSSFAALNGATSALGNFPQCLTGAQPCSPSPMTPRLRASRIRRHPHPHMSTRSTAADLQETRGCSR